MARPRQHDIDERLISAWHELLAETSYEEITMTDIAARAGVGKPALYRRFPTKAHLMFACGVVRSVPERLDDHGSLEADLLPAVHALAESLHAMPRGVYADQIALAIADAEFAERVQAEYAEPALDKIMIIWDRAVARGEIPPDVDGRTALNDLAGALIFDVMVRHGTADNTYLHQLVHRFVDGLRGT
jgi:AcrR family transcriptional regulator